MTPETENTLLKAENAALREQVTVLMARVQDLEGRLAKDSHKDSHKMTVVKMRWRAARAHAAGVVGCKATV